MKWFFLHCYVLVEDINVYIYTTVCSDNLNVEKIIADRDKQKITKHNCSKKLSIFTKRPLKLLSIACLCLQYIF